LYKLRVVRIHVVLEMYVDIAEDSYVEPLQTWAEKRIADAFAANSEVVSAAVSKLTVANR